MPINPNFNGLLEIIRKSRPDLSTMSTRRALYLEFEPAEYLERYAAAIALMEHEGIDALMLTQEENVRYWSGYRTMLWISKFRPYAVILPRDPKIGPRIVVPAHEGPNVENTSWMENLELYPDQADPIPELLDVLADMGLAKPSTLIGTELGFGMRLGMSQDQFSTLKNDFPGRFTDGTPLLGACRMIKSPAEISHLQKACDISQDATQVGFSAIKEGMTERELLAIITAEMYKQGAEIGTIPSFFSITSGAGYNMLNSFPEDYAFKAGDMVMIDGGAVYRGYCTDYIRQASLGDISAERLRLFDIAKEANEAATEAVRPGVTGVDVYEKAMDVFRQHDVFDHNLLTIVGHGVGLDIHELPWLGEAGIYTTDTVLEPGMVLCIEPIFGGVNDPNFKDGIWIQEDKIVVTETGSKVLTDSLSKDLWVQPLGA